MAKAIRKKNLKIQILAGNILMSRFHVSFEIGLPLGILKQFNDLPLDLDISELNEVFNLICIASKNENLLNIVPIRWFYA